jgi:hypothetical protein
MSVDGIWYVKLEDGDVERVTLDELDEAFQCGRVDENSMVLADGAETWMKLCDLLGSSAGGPPQPDPALAATEPALVQAPTAIAAAPWPDAAPTTPVVAERGEPTQAPSRPVAQPEVMASVAQVPVASPTFVTARPPLAAAVGPVAGSVRPVSFDIGNQLDLTDHPFRSSSRKRWVVGAVGAILVAGAVVGFFAVTQTASGAASAPAPVFAAAIAQPPAAAETTAPAPPAPEPTVAGPSSIMDPTQPHLTDEQRRKLLAADHKLKTHAASGGGASTWHAPKEKSTTFTTGGNKYDPLNSSL